MSIADKLRKAAGLFVELPPRQQQEPEETSAPAPTVEAAAPAATNDLDRRLAQMGQTMTVGQIVRDTDGPNLDQISASSQAAPPALQTNGSLDFAVVYQQANLPAAPFSAEQTVEMLASLPPQLPLETKRQTVQVTLGAMGKAIGATPETIVADASRKLAALAAYEADFAKHTGEFVAAAQFEIAALEAQVAEKRSAIEAAQQKQRDVTRLCDGETDRLDDVLEFFSLDVAPSKYAASSSETPPPLPS